MPKSELLADLTDEERARLPGRLRALDRDKQTAAWNAAKAERDAAIAKATDENGVVTDPAAVEAAHENWQVRKAALLGKG